MCVWRDIVLFDECYDDVMINFYLSNFGNKLLFFFIYELLCVINFEVYRMMYNIGGSELFLDEMCINNGYVSEENKVVFCYYGYFLVFRSENFEDEENGFMSSDCNEFRNKIELEFLRLKLFKLINFNVVN